MQTRGILAAISAVLLLFIGFFAYGMKVSSDTRAKVLARQVPAAVEGEDCAVFEHVEALAPALSKMRPADARFLASDHEKVAEHREFVASLSGQIDAFLEGRSCGRAADQLTEATHWDHWVALVHARATLAARGGDPVSAMTDLESLWRLGHVLQSDVDTWAAGTALVDGAGKAMLGLLSGTSPATHDSTVKRIDGLCGRLPDLHAVLDHAVYASELETVDGSAGLMGGVTGIGIAQAVGVFHPVYDRYTELRAQPWAEREAALSAWQDEVDGYAHPIYGRLQGGAVLAMERDAAQHRVRLELLQIAVRAARFARTYGACPTDLARLEVGEQERPFGAYTLDGCTARSPDGAGGTLEVSAR